MQAVRHGVAQECDQLAPSCTDLYRTDLYRAGRHGAAQECDQHHHAELRGHGRDFHALGVHEVRGNQVTVMQ